ncbi:hypothetical protein [Morganella morganii]|uniref:hypothetical protein n=1 Tax=Morganella morganii TaxID=582 RepID=UPI001BDAD2F0|nr:hypothetical protein [Morganella morganii]MBT0338664.1 hypothetical protein [Morganella morganii subsp. morganii]
MTSLYTATKHPEQLETTLLTGESHRYDDPLEPQKLVFLDAVNDQRCVINSPQRNSQLTNTIPFFIAILIMACYTLLGFVDRHASKMYTFQDTITYNKGIYNSYVEDNKKIPRYLEEYVPYFSKEEIDIFDYVKAYCSGRLSNNSNADVLLMIGWLILFPGALWLFGYLAFFTPPVYLTADRKRGLLYSHGRGKVHVTRYEEAQIGLAGKMPAIKLYGIDEKSGELKTIIFRPNVSHYSAFLTSTDSENHRFITFLNAYMQQGRDAVSPVDYQARKPFLSFGKNPLPEDFEQQVAQILTELDKRKQRDAQSD